MTPLNAATLGAAAISVILADLRWLRVAQREHYLPGAVARFGWRWWTSTPLNIALAVVAVVSTGIATVAPAAALASAAVVAMGPAGLRLRGRTSRLAWTRRMSQVGLVIVGLEGLGISLAAAFGSPVDAVVAAVDEAVRAVVPPDRITDVARNRGMANAQVALAWVLQQPGVTAPIIGASKMRHLEDAVAALELKLDDTELKALAAPYQPHRVLGHG